MTPASAAASPSPRRRRRLRRRSLPVAARAAQRPDPGLLVLRRRRQRHRRVATQGPAPRARSAARAAASASTARPQAPPPSQPPTGGPPDEAPRLDSRLSVWRRRCPRMLPGRCSPRPGDFGLNNPDVTFTNADGTPATQAGSHPFALTDSFGTQHSGADSDAFPEGRLKRRRLSTSPPGLVGDTTAYPRCSTADFLAQGSNDPATPLLRATAVGVTASLAQRTGSLARRSRLQPRPAARRRSSASASASSPINVYRRRRPPPGPPYNALAASRNIPQSLNVLGDKTQLWGNPSDPAHDALRGTCLDQDPTSTDPIEEFEFEGNRRKLPRRPQPRPLPHPADQLQREPPLPPAYEAPPGTISTDGVPDTDAGARLTHDAEGNPQPFTGCGKLGFKPSIAAQPTTKAATSPTGLDFTLDIADEGLTNPKRPSPSPTSKGRRHPARGHHRQPLAGRRPRVCTEADLRAETPRSAAGRGLPQRLQDRHGRSRNARCSTKPSTAPSTSPSPTTTPSTPCSPSTSSSRTRSSGSSSSSPRRSSPTPSPASSTTIADDIPQLPFSHFQPALPRGRPQPRWSPRPPAAPTTPKPTLYPLVGRTTPVDHHLRLPDHSRPRRRPLPLRRPAALPPGPDRRHHQQRRRALLAPSTCASPATTPNRRSPTSRSSCPRGSSASSPASPTAPTRRSPPPRPGPAPTAARKSSTAPPARPPPRSAAPWSAPASARPRLRPRQDLPRRPLQRLQPLDRRDHRRPRSAPSTSAPSSSARP